MASEFLVALSDMPQMFLQQRLTPLAQAKLPASDQQELAEEYIRQSQQIQEVVTRLEANYAPNLVCPSQAG